uniref:Uncharacterized protein MANES_05G163100 n=2 Tax=Rhizophora mucronata TaxID=61149 RepID=A0A2P2KC53_RHIMU
MEKWRNSGDRLSGFMESGIYRFENSNAVFLDPVRVLNRSYTRFRVSPRAYYSRFFDSKDDHQETTVPSSSKKRKRKEKKTPALNDRERAAEHRHQQVRPRLLKAHESLIEAADLLAIMRNLRGDSCSPTECKNLSRNCAQQSLAELGRVWQAPLYDITLNFPQQGPRRYPPSEDGGGPIDQCGQQRVLPAFNNLVVNETSDDVEADFLDRNYIIPRDSCFYMSDLEQIHNLCPAECTYGFNIIVVDPPWENASARQKLVYSTLPNRYFLSLPIKQLTHEDGALVALWVTNREKCRTFVEKELFPAWGVTYAASKTRWLID